MSLLAFFTRNWRWLAVGVGVIFIGLFSIQGVDYARAGCTRRRLSKQVYRTEQQHDARAAQEPARRHDFDSAFYSLAGQHREAVKAGTIAQHDYDSIRRLLPATGLPALPSQPRRYRPAPPAGR